MLPNSVIALVRADLEAVEVEVRAAGAVAHPAFAEGVATLVGAGGRRLRPVIMLLIARALDVEGGVRCKVVLAAAASELLHTAALVHDDLMDRAEFRRGVPALNTLFDSNMVILLGDYLFAQSARTAARCGNTRVMEIFGQILAEIAEGQLQELLTLRNPDQSLRNYEERIYGKAAALFAGSAEIAATLATVSPAAAAGLRSYGREVGMALQVIDDVIDLEADLTQGVVTLPVLLYLRDGHDRVLATALRDVVGRVGNERDAADIARRLRETTAMPDSIQQARDYIRMAKSALDVLPSGKARVALAALADSLIPPGLIGG